MKKSIKILLCALIILVFKQAYANNAAQFIKLDTNQYGAVTMVNRSNKTLNIRYCIHDNGSFSCAKQRFGGKTLSSGSSEIVLGAKGKQVQWAACVYPKLVSGWNTRTNRYNCR